MPTHNLKLPKNYRNATNDYYVKVGIGLIVLLLIFNLVLLTLFLKELKNSRQTMQVLEGANRSLALFEDSLGKTEMQKALIHLTDARRQIASALPPQPVEPSAKAGQIQLPPPETSAESKSEPAAPPVVAQRQQPSTALPVKTATEPPPVKTSAESKSEPMKPPIIAQKPSATPAKAVPLSIPAGEMPAPLGWATPGEHALVCEKENKTLHLFKCQDERFAYVKSFPCIIGANGTNKKKAGDHATPMGSYFTLRYTPGSALQEIYGEGAFVLNYPNFLDRKENRQGGGIWIHGHVPGKVVGTGDLVNTKGCIAVSNDIIREFKKLLDPSGTSVSIVDKILFVKESDQKESLQEIRNFMNAWRQAWESGNTQNYMRYYSKDFISSEGMNFAAFRRHKEQVNSGKRYIRVKAEQMAIVFPQAWNGRTAIVRFVQKYNSSNFDSIAKKLFYLKKGNEGWAICGESVF